MTHIPEDSKVLYRSKDGKNEKTFDAIEWIAAKCSHVPNNGEQMIRYRILKHLGLWEVKPRPPPRVPKWPPLYRNQLLLVSKQQFFEKVKRKRHLQSASG